MLQPTGIYVYIYIYADIIESNVMTEVCRFQVELIQLKESPARQIARMIRLDIVAAIRVHVLAGAIIIIRSPNFLFPTTMSTWRHLSR